MVGALPSRRGLAEPQPVAMSSTETPAPAAPPAAAEEASATLAQRLADTCVELRRDLEVSRHVFRGEVAYIIQDPLTYSSHRFKSEEYFILTCLHVERTLGETFKFLVDNEHLKQKDEDQFFQFILSMHRCSFLKLPISDEKTLYKRHMARKESRSKGRLASAMFLQIPLINPDRFLTRTIKHVRPLCGRRALLGWCLLMLAALVTLLGSWSEFIEPVADIFSSGNLPLLWGTLILLKLVHEFGHAYACKYFGGHVPEMGIYLILFTPCAFVDTTSAWGFHKKSQRLAVCMGGMYVELAVAALALLLWSVMEPGVMRSALHNVVMLASVVTVGFNINPLMRYDGYYALSDWVEVPNLRARSQAHAINVLKRISLGVPLPASKDSRWLQTNLFFFGLAGAMYKATLVVGISMAIALKFFLGGLLLGSVYFGNEILKLGRRLLPYLWHSEEAAQRRFRAIGYSALVLAGLPLFALTAPLPAHVSAPAVVVGDGERTLRAEASGFLRELGVQAGDQVQGGQTIARLEEPDNQADLAMMQARREVSRLRLSALQLSLPAAAEVERKRLVQFDEEIAFLEGELERLNIVSQQPALVAACLHSEDLGRFVKRGEEIATLITGRPLVRALLTAEGMAAVSPRVGMPVEFRSHATPGRSWSGTIRQVTPAGSRVLDRDFTDHLELDQFALHPLTQQASSSQFELKVELENEADGMLLHGLAGRIRLRAKSETLAASVYRKLVLFAAKLKR